MNSSIALKAIWIQISKRRNAEIQLIGTGQNKELKKSKNKLMMNSKRLHRRSNTKNEAQFNQLFQKNH